MLRMHPFTGMALTLCFCLNAILGDTTPKLISAMTEFIFNHGLNLIEQLRATAIDRAPWHGVPRPRVCRL